MWFLRFKLFFTLRNFSKDATTRTTRFPTRRPDNKNLNKVQLRFYCHDVFLYQIIPAHMRNIFLSVKIFCVLGTVIITSSDWPGVITSNESKSDPAQLNKTLINERINNRNILNAIIFQVCDYCDPNIPEKTHPPEYAVDGMETWWQSPPLSRGMKYNEVNLTIDLGQVR